MNICFLTESTLNNAWQERLDDLKGQDLIVFGYNSFGLVSYKKELTGETEYFHDLAKLSKQLQCVIICGCDTDTYGVFKHSAVLADKGKILGVSDMAHAVDDSEFTSGGNFRVYDTSVGKIGILVMEDLFFPEASRVLTLCDADLIVCVFKKIDNYIPLLMLRACAFSNGILTALCADNYASVSDVRGDVIIGGNSDFIKTKVKIEKDYHLITSRRRGLYRDFNSGY
mgnify:CR=1 FL=1